MAVFNPNVARTSIIQRLFDQLVVNVLYHANTGNGSFQWDEDNLFVLADEMSQFWQAEILPFQSADLTLEGADTYSLASSEAPSSSFRFATPQPGGDGTASLPGSVALSVSFRTGGRGRTSRGRNYVSGLTESQVTGNLVSQARVDQIVGGYRALIPLVVVPQTAWCVYSQFFEGSPRPTGTFRFVDEVVVVDRTVDSQRRRLPGRGSV